MQGPIDQGKAGKDHCCSISFANDDMLPWHAHTDVLFAAALDQQPAQPLEVMPLRPPMFANNSGEAAEYCLVYDAFQKWVFHVEVSHTVCVTCHSVE